MPVVSDSLPAFLGKSQPSSTRFSQYYFSTASGSRRLFLSCLGFRLASNRLRKIRFFLSLLNFFHIILRTFTEFQDTLKKRNRCCTSTGDNSDGGIFSLLVTDNFENRILL
jgi:hypothetical protein